MPSINEDFFPPQPKLFRAVDRPAGVPDSEISKALPVYIDGLGSGGGDASVAWEDVTGKPTTFAPAAHTHAWSEVTEKPTTFDPATHTHDVSDVSGLQALITELTDRIVALETAATE